jgi:hypothetical protein
VTTETPLSPSAASDLIFEHADVSVAMPDARVAMRVSRREDGEARARAGGS